MDTQLLRDQQEFPTKEVLKNALGKSFPVFEKLMESISEEKYGIEADWHYYKDGKAWLCKAIHKKKTVFWLSVWDQYFKTTFYFTEKNSTGIPALGINQNLKDAFIKNKPIGRLIPLTIEVKSKEELSDVLQLAEYKKSLK